MKIFFFFSHIREISVIVKKNELFDIGVWKYLRFRGVRMFCWVFNNFADTFGIFADVDDLLDFLGVIIPGFTTI